MSTYRIISSSELIQRQAEWQNLVSLSSTLTVFEQPAYQLSWLNNFTTPHQSKLEGVVDAQNKLVAVLPFFWETPTTLRLIGAVDLSDYLDLVIEPSQQDQIYSWLGNYFATDLSNWQEIKLESLPATSPSLAAFSQLAKKHVWNINQTQQDVSPAISLPQTWDAYLAGLEPKSQQTFKRLLKTIGVEDEITYRCLEKKEDIKHQITTFIALHKASSTEKLQFWTKEREAFFVDATTGLAKNGWVKLYFLDVDGMPAASLLIFDYQDQYLLYNSGYDAYRFGHLGVGNALILHTIKDAIEHHKTRYDFMRGDEAYKFLFGATSESVFDLTITKT